MDKWNHPKTTVCRQLSLNPSCSEQSHSNSPGTGHENESTEFGSTVTKFHVPIMISLVRLFSSSYVDGTNECLDLSLTWQAS